jgi:L-cysteine S-thiosulfotransferase
MRGVILSVALIVASGSAHAQVIDQNLQEAARRIVGADAARGRAVIVEKGCQACHRIPGVGAPFGRVGPDLEGLEQRAVIAGTLPNRPDRLVAWLIDPPRWSPDTAMPPLGLTDQQAKDVAAYLYRQSP